MKIKSYLGMFLLFTLINTTPLSGQFGSLKDKIVNRTKDKLERKAEDKLVEAISEELARRAFKPIGKAMDDMLKSNYEGNEDVEGVTFEEYLAALNKSASVPSSYTFDVTIKMEIKDYEKEKHEMSYFFPKEGAYVGILQEDDGNENMIVIDSENDVIVLYFENEDGDKSAQAAPSMMKFAGAMMAEEMKKEMDEDFKIEKTGKTKKIKGYLTHEYTVESEKQFSKSYIAEDFPVSFGKAFGESLNNFMPANYKQTMDLLDGMVLQSEHESKELDGKKSTMKTKDIKEETFTIDNVEYGLGAGNNGQE